MLGLYPRWVHCCPFQPCWVRPQRFGLQGSSPQLQFPSPWSCFPSLALPQDLDLLPKVLWERFGNNSDVIISESNNSCIYSVHLPACFQPQLGGLLALSVIKSVVFKGEEKSIKLQWPIFIARAIKERCSEGPGKLLFKLGLIRLFNIFFGMCQNKQCCRRTAVPKVFAVLCSPVLLLKCGSGGGGPSSLLANF